MSTDKKEETSLGLKTKVRMDFVILLLSGAASFTLIYSKLVNMDEKMQHSWTIQHEMLWTKQFQTENPSVKVPDPQAIVDMMNQKEQPMNTLLQLNDSLAHAPAGVVAMLFAIALGYVLKASDFFPSNRIPAVVVPVTALLFGFIQLFADLVEKKPDAGYYFIFNFMLGFVYGAVAWLLHAQILRRFVDPKMFNDDGTTKFFTKPKDSTPDDPAPTDPKQ